MSLVDRLALEALFRNDKILYDNLLNKLNFSSKKEGFTNNVFLASQMNKDLQTSLLSMSNTLSPAAKEQYQLLAASRDLEEQYDQLVGDSRIVTDMQYARYFAWALGALALILVLVRAKMKSSS
jgi:hypothetical protein